MSLGPDGSANTEDDGAASSLNEWIKRVDNAESLEAKEKALLKNNQRLFRSTATTYQMSAARRLCPLRSLQREALPF